MQMLPALPSGNESRLLAVESGREFIVMFPPGRRTRQKRLGKDCPVFVFRALHLHTGMAGGLLMPVCDLPNRLAQGVDNDGGSAVAEALDGEVVGLIGVFGGVPKADDDAIVWKV